MLRSDPAIRYSDESKSEVCVCISSKSYPCYYTTHTFIYELSRMTSPNHPSYASRRQHTEPGSLAPPILPCRSKLKLPDNLLCVHARFQHANHTEYDLNIVHSAYPAENHIEDVTMGSRVENAPVEA